MNSLYERLYTEIENSELKKYPLLNCCMKDGILFPEKYEKSSLKMVFILKEPYADWDEKTNTPKNCDIDFFDLVRNLKSFYEDGFNKTWLKVAAISYSIKNETSYTESLTYEQVEEGLSCVAWINLSKTPWRTTTIRNKAFQKRVSIWEPVVKEQLLQLNPDIIFYGNTWDSSALNPIEPNLEWKTSFCSNKKIYKRKRSKIYIFKYRDTKKIILNGYHPVFGLSAKWQTECLKKYISKFCE